MQLAQMQRRHFMTLLGGCLVARHARAQEAGRVYRVAFSPTRRDGCKVLRGAKPGDLPVEQPSKFKLVVNLNTAKAINCEVPAGLRLRADKVIE